MIEEYLIKFCSPTLASLKPGSLFTVSCCNKQDIEQQIFEWNEKFSCKNIRLFLMRYTYDTALVYICRKNALKNCLAQKATSEFLKNYGYFNDDVFSCVSRLRDRISSCDNFPHEVGVFLGYPLDDVKGFIENSGKNCKCCGCWKVYCNPAYAEKVFAKYKKCRDVYTRLWQNGRSIMQLTVAA